MLREPVGATQRDLISEVHPRHHGIHSLAVHFGKAQPAALQEEVARMLCVVQVVGVVYNSLDIAFVVADRHAGFKYIFHLYLFQLLFYTVS